WAVSFQSEKRSRVFICFRVDTVPGPKIIEVTRVLKLSCYGGDTAQVQSMSGFETVECLFSVATALKHDVAKKQRRAVKVESLESVLFCCGQWFESAVIQRDFAFIAQGL